MEDIPVTKAIDKLQKLYSEIDRIRDDLPAAYRYFAREALKSLDFAEVQLRLVMNVDKDEDAKQKAKQFEEEVNLGQHPYDVQL